MTTEKAGALHLRGMQVRATDDANVLISLETDAGEKQFVMPGPAVMEMVARLVAAANSLPIGTVQERPAVKVKAFTVALDRSTGSIGLALGVTTKASIGFSLAPGHARKLGQELARAVDVAVSDQAGYKTPLSGPSEFAT